MYHGISNPIKNKFHPYYYETTTSPDVFAKHIRFLYENSYSVLSLRDAARMLSENKQINQSVNRQTNYAVITFDDGFSDFYSEAFPILQEHGFPATVFLPTSFIDNNNRFKNKECLSWSEVRELKRKGVNFGSHTVNHPELYRISKLAVMYELRKSKEIISNQIGESIDSFSYPYAFPEQDKEFIAYMKGALKNCGYNYGVTTRIGTALEKEDPLFFRRIPINSYDDQFFFKAKLEGAYDWIYKMQFLYKKIKTLTN